MSEPLVIDLFAEDRAHELWFKPLLERLAREEKVTVRVRVRSARGGHGQAITELKKYQQVCDKGIIGDLPDLVVVAIDANCASLSEAQKKIDDCLGRQFKHRTITATPDPHIERWFLADLDAFHRVVGITPQFKKRKHKCKRDYYKSVLAKAVQEAGHPPTLGGIEFARQLVEALDFSRACKDDSSFRHFVDQMRAALKRAKT